MPVTKLNREKRGGAGPVAELVRRLVALADPDRIILFGSRARGDQRPESDIDLLVIKPSDKPRHERVVPLYAALKGVGVPADILWFTPEEVADWSGAPDYICTTAVREGRVVYEKPH